MTRRRWTDVLPAAALLCAWAGAAAAQSEYRAAVIRVDAPGPLPISRLDLPPADLGLAGAKLATEDNATTGRFMKQSFTTETVVATPETAEAEMRRLVGEGIRFIVTLADDAMTVKLADAAGPEALVFNAAAHGDRLRGADCRPNLLHTAPSDAMLADALAQFLAWKRWNRIFLVEGSHPEDRALAEAYRHAAKKFGLKIVEERVYEDRGGARRTDSGQVPGQQEMPAFTQRAPDYDVLIAADRAGVFADYLPYHTWDPRPVAGSAGLEPVSWTPSQEAWAGTQFQSRFEKVAARPIREEDYQVWMALRSLGEAATRTKSEDFATLRDFIASGKMELAAFKGQKLTFRDWDGQLRQPILLAAGPVVATVSPQAEFLHQVSQLDTLGTDRPEKQCKR